MRSDVRRFGVAGLACAWALGALGCGSSVRKYPLAEPLRVDPDRAPYSPRPDEYYSPFAWDGADNIVFRPISRFLAVDPAGESVNVNALDEVPDSSWWTNRIGVEPMTPEEFARGACTEPPLDPNGTWTVTDAKPNGANPGFIIEDAEGRKFLLKFDGLLQGPRATSADVIGSILYHAAGYFAPCNRIVHFDKAQLRIAEDATAETSAGEETALTWAMIDAVLAKGQRTAGGKYRASSSRFLDGRPIGPWRYEGTRDGDPNDAIPHDDRREIRGGRVIAAWLNHFDAREQNTLATWVDAGEGRGYVQHYYIDFGDCFGSLWDWDGISRRLGYSSYLDVPDVIADLVTLGLLERPWDRVSFGVTGPIFGYYGVEQFEPDEWEPGYSNQAFQRMSERDGAWMTRILAQMEPAHLRAAIAEARIQDVVVRAELYRVLYGRLRRIYDRWLAHSVSPLTHPTVEPRADGASLCVQDLLVHTGLVSPERRMYWARAFVGDDPDAKNLGRARVRRDARDQVCVDLPDAPSSSPSTPTFVLVDVAGLTGPDDEAALPLRVHLYRRGSGDYVIAGLERPFDGNPPAP